MPTSSFDFDVITGPSVPRDNRAEQEKPKADAPRQAEPERTAPPDSSGR
ncbi:MAG: hypothetical protein AB7F35_04650 [Acetobacteraceae bacterium]